MNRLNQTFVRKVAEPGRYGDGRGSYGLALRVQPRANGGVAKSYTQQLRGPGRILYTLGLGSAEHMTLQQAREAAMDNARRLRSGEEIHKTRTAPPALSRVTPTFHKAMETYIVKRRSEWKAGSRTEVKLRAGLTRYCDPLMELPVNVIVRGHVRDVLEAIPSDLIATRNKTRAYLRDVLSYAVYMEWRTDNPVDDSFKTSRAKTQHHRALPPHEIAGVLDKIEASVGWPHLTLALRFLALTCVRPNEALGARWSEVDMATRTWTIPAARMKQSVEHRVPLSGAALDVLRRAADLSDGSETVFPSATGKMLNTSRLTEAFRRCEIDAVPHGLRSSFRDWAGMAAIQRDIAEQCLAHRVGSEVELAYRRTDYFLQRAVVMERWAAVVEGREIAGEVVQFTDATQKVS